MDEETLLIIGIVTIVVVLFLIWTTLHTKKSRKKKSKPVVESKDAVPTEKPFKKVKPVIKKRNLEKDFNREEIKIKDGETMAKGAGGGTIEKVFIEPIKKEEPVENVSNKPAKRQQDFDDRDDFERELDELIAELERETNGTKKPDSKQNSMRQPKFDFNGIDDDFKFDDGFNPNMFPYSNDFMPPSGGQMRTSKNLNYSDNLDFSEPIMAGTDTLITGDNYFNFEDEVENDDDSIEQSIKSKVEKNIVDDSYFYAPKKKDPNVPDFDTTSFEKRRDKWLDKKDDKTVKNIIVVGDSEDSRQKAKKNRNKWL